MTTTLNDVARKKQAEQSAEQQAAVELVRLAKEQGLSLTPAVIRLWDNAWAEFIPFLDYDVEIRRVICSTNAIESLNAHLCRFCP